MGYRLAMSDEIRDWLTDLRSADPSAARLVGEALTALISGGASLGPPLVTPVTTYRRPVVLADALDSTYQVCLEKLQFVRRRVAEAATNAKQLHNEITALGAADDPADHDRLAELRRRLAAAEETEAKQTIQSQRLQGMVDAFRTRKEVLKARYAAAEAEQRVQQILDQFDAEAGLDDTPGHGAVPEAAVGVGEPAEGAGDLAGDRPAGTDAGTPVAAGTPSAATPPTSADDGASAAADIPSAAPSVGTSAAASGRPASGPGTSAAFAGTSAGPAGNVPAAESEIAQIEREIEREIKQVLSPVPEAPRVGAAPPAELLELRPGAPGDNGIRVLFGVEPPGTALLISVLEGGEALRDHYDEAVELSADVLREVRAGEAPEAAARVFAIPDEFLGEFFPGDADRVSAAAADLIARNRGRTLEAERSRLGLSQAQVAERMSTTREQVEAIERAEPGATDVGTLAAYVRALGGRLEIIADFGGERVPLRGPTDPAS
jgi:hypothetical protein